MADDFQPPAIIRHPRTAEEVIAHIRGHFARARATQVSESVPEIDTRKSEVVGEVSRDTEKSEEMVRATEKSEEMVGTKKSQREVDDIRGISAPLPNTFGVEIFKKKLTRNDVSRQARLYVDGEVVGKLKGLLNDDDVTTMVGGGKISFEARDEDGLVWTLDFLTYSERARGGRFQKEWRAFVNKRNLKADDILEFRWDTNHYRKPLLVINPHVRQLSPVEMIETSQMFGGSMSTFKYCSSTLGFINIEIFLPPGDPSPQWPVMYWMYDDASQDRLTGALRLASTEGVALISIPGGKVGPHGGENWEMYCFVVRELPELLSQHFPLLDTARAAISGYSGGNGPLSTFLREGVKFDPQTGSTLHIEMARSNSRRKHKPGSGPYVVIDNRTKPATDARESSSDDVSDTDEPATNVDSYQYDSATEKSTEKATNSNDAIDPENEQEEKRTDGACSTLFIANLGPNCTETELKQYLSQYQGFNSLKVRARGGMPVAFADFERVEAATEAMNALQGCLLPSSDRGGMHIEYARSKMRKP